MHQNVYLTLGFLVVYCSLVTYARSTCWGDPTSKFFQANRAHVSTYSSHRLREASEYAELMGEKQLSLPSETPNIEATANDHPGLCVGIPSVERQGTSYLKTTLGSLQHGLSTEERRQIQFVVFLAHVNGTDHSDYDRPWIKNMVDVFPTYADDPETLSLVQEMEVESKVSQKHATKSKLDYSIVLEACQRTSAPHTLMVEDDVVFLDGWFHRTMKALDSVTSRTYEAGHTNFLYLRLFYFEALLGWNAQSWPKYLLSSLAVTATVLGMLLLVRRCIPASRSCLPRSSLLLVGFIFTPLLIGLCFVSGGNCIFPQPDGVQIMSSNTCCGQALVFPRATVLNDLLPHFKENRWSKKPTDSFIERHGDETGGLRWALTPVVAQHVGGQSSHGVDRGDKFGNLAPKRIWNYGFEENRAAELAEEHEKVKQSDDPRWNAMIER